MSYIEKFWRDATADVVDVMNGKEIEARFRDLDREDWSKPSTLKGWTADGKKWLGFCAWNFCQVYSPPQWFLDKPEPGEGYRLLGKFPHEPRQPKDDVFVDGTWRTTEGCGPQPETLWYRRKIERLLPGHRWLIQGDRLESGDLYFDKGAVVEVDHNYWGNKVVIGEAFMRKIEQPKPEPKHYKLQVGDTADTGNGFRLTVTEHGVEFT